MTPNAEIRAFLRQIASAPEDDLPRLVFADWLDEHPAGAAGRAVGSGGAASAASSRADRAEFIRVECGIARTEPGDPRRPALFERRDTLFKAHSAEWFALFAGKAVAWKTERGFVAEVTAPPEAFLAHADGWFGTQPITRLKLTNVWSGYPPDRRCHARELLTCRHLCRLTHLNLESAGVNAAGVYYLSQLPGPLRLRELSLRHNEIRDAGSRTLAGMPGLAGLESLDLVGCRITDSGARELVGSVHLNSLRELRITGNPIGDGAWLELQERFGEALVG